MTVELLHFTPLWVCSTAIRKCWASEDKSDTSGDVIGEKDMALIERVGNKNKHASTLEHLNYSFDIDGISRACLQELARHRHASLSVKSTRYTLKELRDASDYSFVGDFIVLTDNYTINELNTNRIIELRSALKEGISNDVAKYCIPEAYKTSLVWTINARALQNFLQLRTNKAALKEIQELAHKVYDVLPDKHKYLFKEFVNECE